MNLLISPIMRDNSTGIAGYSTRWLYTRYASMYVHTHACRREEMSMDGHGLRSGTPQNNLIKSRSMFPSLCRLILNCKSDASSTYRK